MNVLEYKNMLAEEFLASAEANETSPSLEFMYYVVDMFNDIEEVFDMTPCYFQSTGSNNRKILIDGYAYDESDKSYVFFVVKYDQSDEIITITKSEIDTYVKNMSAFVENSLSRQIQINNDVSCQGYQVADTLWRRFINKDVTKFKFYVLTNCMLSNNIKTIEKQKICEKSVEINVWDIQRFYDKDVASRAKEPIFIDFRKYNNGKGLQAIKAVDKDNEEYTAYLAVINGSVLADIYDEYGSRLLEGNVRSFLSAGGKVNKKIRNTILNEPKHFFAYNNGIATTASDLEVEMTENGLEIITLRNLQIINGGQTTASLLNARINHKSEARLDEIYVPMKLTVIKSDNFDEMVERISRSANSQNKVSEADFFSNNPFHIKFEQISKRNPAPAVNGNQFTTYWFYERARGSYKQEQMKLTKAQRDKFALRYPKSQMIQKTDLAKYRNSYDMQPHLVSRGAQKNMSAFAEKIIKTQDKNVNDINDYFFIESIGLAIIFKTLEKDISRSQWFPEGSGYRANIVTYTMAKLFYLIKRQYNSQASLNFNLIWSKQKVYPELARVLNELAYETYKFINRSDRQLMNISEWCKKEECWKRYSEVNYTLPEYFGNTLLKMSDISEFKTSAKKDERINTQVANEAKVVELGAKYWQKLMEKAKERGICNVVDEGDLRVAIRMESTGRIPNSVQAKRLLAFKKKCEDEGIVL